MANLKQDNTNCLPNHIAMILDGNRRWAKNQDKPQYYGHINGAKNIYNLCNWCLMYNIKYLTLYCLSFENLNRDKDELNFLFKAIKDNFNCKEIEDLKNSGVKIKVIGETYLLPSDVVSSIKAVEKYNDSIDVKLNLQICLCYGGRQEILSAIKNILKAVEEGKINKNEISNDIICNYLYTKNIPDPDLMIRCGREKRLSNFLLWQLSYTELYFCDKLWPDFKEEDFLFALYDFQNRKRRYGK